MNGIKITIVIPPGIPEQVRQMIYEDFREMKSYVEEATGPTGSWKFDVTDENGDPLWDDIQ